MKICLNKALVFFLAQIASNLLVFTPLVVIAPIYPNHKKNQNPSKQVLFI